MLIAIAQVTKSLYIGMTHMSSRNIIAKIYENKRVDKSLNPLDIIDLCNESVCIDFYLKNSHTAKFLIDCSKFLEEDAYIQICENNKQVFEWLVISYNPSTRYKWKAEIVLESIKWRLENRDRVTIENHNFVDIPFWQAIQEIFDSISFWQSKESRCVDSLNDFNVSIEISRWTNIITAIETILWDSWYERDIRTWKNPNTWDDCCLINIQECLWIDRTIWWTNYVEVLYDEKSTDWNSINDISLIWKAKRKNQVIATATINGEEEIVIVDDWWWCIVWTDNYSTEAIDFADLSTQANERLLEVNTNKRVYKIWTEVDAIDANIWDKVRLLISWTKFDYDWPVTVLRKTVCYIWWKRKELVYIWDPSVDIPTRRQVLNKLLDV